MAEPTENFPIVREAVASFADRGHFQAAVGELLAAGFEPSDLSVLAAHDSLEAAGNLAAYPKEQHPWLPAALADEVKWLAPLTAAGIVLLSSGPVAAGIAALVAAGLGGAAIKEVLDRYTTGHHTKDFAAALAAGAVLLWVRCEDTDRELRATRILAAAGGQNVHVHGRPHS